MRPPDIRPKDLRKYSIIPFNAVMDKRINRTRAIQVLAVVCSYVDRNGVTFVSQDRIASDLGISRQAVNKQMRILRELGYWVYARKRSQDQKTQSIKIIYDESIRTEEEAMSNQKPEHQIEMREESSLNDIPIGPKTGETPEVAGETSRVAGESVPGATFSSPGETSEVARPETSEVALDENINVVNGEFKEMVRRYCNHFLRAGDTLGQPRTISEREEQVMGRWISHGLLEAEWRVILADHVKYCREKRRDYARGLGYFEEPVKRSLSRVPNATARQLLASIKSRSQSTR